MRYVPVYYVPESAAIKLMISEWDTLVQLEGEDGGGDGQSCSTVFEEPSDRVE